ncbi:MAG TPA: 23S rRNA (adenine(2503)-C(2))-methyltransferase RlmN [Bacteroidia bacterium]|jgi:23S rRNA (adenine2503-C2)-methyltransferase|nr:23S rRNA (adenine(2503)-C(2))-methyltransferase RlmN [Bacteroidia bacterium]
MTAAGNISPENIRHLELADIKAFFKEHGEPAFRATQVYEWLWKKSAHSFDEMSNLSKATREKLKEHFVINAVEIDLMQKSKDGTIKNAFRLFDGKKVEGVLIPAENRMTACVSSQVGCSLECKFCATGKLKRERNLGADEIYDEVVYIQRQAMEHFKMPLSNIVYMGMGEPLLNYSNVLGSIEKITSPEGLNLSPQRITLSTAGVAKMIKKLGDDEVKFNLALSLHAATDEKRNQIMPINESNPLKEVAEALQYFYKKTGTQVTYEYIVFKDFNDTPQDAYHLAEFCKVVPSKVNLIEYNPIDEGRFQQTLPERLQMFVRFLRGRKIIVNVRHSRGKDIDAACGQLANKVIKEAVLK